ncbi:MAG: hypothetical protein ABI629_10190 [bacterium]
MGLLAFGGCGGSGSGSGGGGGANAPGVVWPDRGGGMSSTLPAAVVTGRVIFQSASGEACCVAVDPTLLTPNPGSGQGVLILDDLAPGPATVTVAGFSTDFAPTVPGITATCKTVRAAGAAPCDQTRNASPAFESAPLAVNIVAGAQINLGAIDVSALPFVLQNFSPAQNESVPPPVRFDFTVADPVTGVAAESVVLEVTVNVPDEKQPPEFHSLTKRIPLTLKICTDGSATPCNPTGDLELAGFIAAGVAENLPEGPAEVRITAQNLAVPPRDVDFRYIFTVLPEPSATPTAPPATETPTAEANPHALQGNVPAAQDGAPSAGADARAVEANAAAGSAGGYAAELPTPTPTATPII